MTKRLKVAWVVLGVAWIMDIICWIIVAIAWAERLKWAG